MFLLISAAERQIGGTTLGRYRNDIAKVIFQMRQYICGNSVLPGKLHECMDHHPIAVGEGAEY